MATVEERMQILKMIEARQISAEEGARLLEALDKADRAGQAPTANAARWFRVRVTDLRTGKNKVNVNIPMSLVNVGMKMGARFAPNVDGLDMAVVAQALHEGRTGMLAKVENLEDNERVEIYVE
jgi:hypothetical protein